MNKQNLQILVAAPDRVIRAEVCAAGNLDEYRKLRFFEADSVKSAIETAVSRQPDCVIAGGGFSANELVEIFKALETSFPLILLNGSGENVTPAGIEFLDQIEKNKISSEILSRAVRSSIEIFRLRRDRKQFEETSNRYRLLIEQSRDIILFLDKNGGIVEANRAALDAYGYSRKEILTKNLYDIRSPETWEEIPRLFEIASREGVSFKTIHRRKDGSTFPVEVSWSKADFGEDEILISIIRNITEREQAAARLLESRNFNKQIVEVVPSVVYVRDLVTQENIFINRSVSETLGYSPEDVAGFGASFAETAMHPDDFAKVPEYQAKFQTLGEGETIEFEYRMRHKNGEWLWFLSCEAVFRRDENGSPLQIIGTATDITTRKKAEEKLKANEARFQLAFAAVQSVIYDWNITEDTIERSSELVNLIGFDNGEPGVACNKWWLSRVHPDDLERSAKIVSDAIESGADRFEDEYRLRHKNGEYVWVRDSGVFLKDEMGKTVRCVGSVRSIEARKRAESALQDSNRRYQTLAEVSPDAIFINLDGKIVFVNHECVRLLGASSADQLIGKSPFDLIHPEYHDKVRERIAELLNGKQSVTTVEEKFIRMDGSLIDVEVAAAVFPENEKMAILVTLRDISERKEDEEKLRRSEERMRLATQAAGMYSWEVDIINQKVKWSENAAHVLQLEPDELTEDFAEILKYLHPDDYESAGLAFMNAVTEGAGYDAEFRLVNPRGTAVWLHATGVVTFNEKGEAVRLVGISQDITDRKNAEEQIRQSEERLRVATDVADMFSWETDLVRQKIKWSENTAKILGCRPEELKEDLEHSVFFVLPEDRERIQNVFKEALEAGTSGYVCEFRGIGDRYWQAHGMIVRDGGGTPVKVFGVTQNITARKRAEEKIETANYRFRVAEEAAKGFNYEWNVETGETTRSESIERVLGWRREELSRSWNAWWNLIHPDDRSVQTIDEAIEFINNLGEDSYGGEYRVRHKDGHYIWVLERALLIRGENGRIVRVVGQTMDITERKMAQEKLLAAERRAVSDYRKLLSRIAPLAQTLGTARELDSIYRALLEFIRVETPCEGFFVSFYDAENQLKRVKYVWCEGAELDAEKIEPIRLFETDGANSRAISSRKSIVSERRLDEMNGNFQIIGENKNSLSVHSLVTPMTVMGRVIGTLEVQNHEEKYRREHIGALEMAAGLAAVSIENVRLINVESEARAAAESANRAKDEFLAMLSHELRSPLNAMYGWTQILEKSGQNPAVVKQAVEVISRNVRLQKALIEDLLDVSRIISGKMQLERETVSLVSVVQASLDAARPAAENKSISITFEVETDADEVFGDKHRLQQIIGNLLTNSLKFTAEGGAVNLRLKRGGGRQIKLTVTDTGIGIEPELLPFIFDRFTQADVGSKRKYGGLGLGLTIVKHLTELHGGIVSAHSEGTDKGAEFTVAFPLAPHIVSHADTQVKPNSESANGQAAKRLAYKKILAVDDDRDVLDLICFALEQEGAAAACCNTVGEAIKLLETNDFDLLISDLGMAEMDGFDLIEKIRRHPQTNISRIPAIALTGYVSTQDRERVLAAGFQIHKPKPVDIDNLINSAQKLINSASTS